MKINKITQITEINFRVFKDFAWPQNLSPFQTKNLIYGWNGSGKTTLADIFHAIEQRKGIEDGNFTLEIGGKKKIKSNEIGRRIGELPEIRVFSKRYVEQNVLTAEGKAKAIVHLGEDSIEKQKNIQRLEERIANQQEEMGQEKSKLTTANQEFEAFCSNKARDIKGHIGLSGKSQYNNYDKLHFKKKANSFAPLPDREIEEKVLNDKTPESLQSRIHQPSKKTIENIASIELDLENLFSGAKALLKDTVISQTLNDLKDNPVLSNWIKQGLDIHKQNDAYEKSCAFCQGSLSEKRLKKLENHFNDNYQIFEARIAELIHRIENAIDSINDQDFPHEKEFYDDIEKSYKHQQGSLKENIERAKKWLESLKKELETKQGKPFESINITTREPAGISLSVSELNSVIDRHNKRTEKFTAETENARRELEEHFVAGALEDYRNKKDDISASEQKIEVINKEVGRLGKEKQEIEQSIENTVRPAEELNKGLASFLGRDEIKFTNESGGYVITRNGYPAKNLSEGERTALAFLHFLKSLSDKSFDLEKGIVVIDDPISSLDSNSIYSAFSFMKNKTAEAGQLFVMTHNFIFFKEVRRWFCNNKNEPKKDCHLYMLRVKLERKERVATISKLDPLLRKFESEYHFLFSMVYNSQKDKNLIELYPMPNIARKLLEEFFSFKNPSTNDLREKMKDFYPNNTETIDRIIRFTHTNSHADKIGDTEDLSVFQELPSIMRDIMKLIKETDKDHFDKMKSIV